jgi:hypothetical protein
MISNLANFTGLQHSGLTEGGHNSANARLFMTRANAVSNCLTNIFDRCAPKPIVVIQIWKAGRAPTT